MKISRFSIRILITHIVISILQLFFMPSLFSILSENFIYQWFIGMLFIFIFWMILYLDVRMVGSDDIKSNNFNKAKGFISGVYAIIPILIIYALAIMYQSHDTTLGWLFSVMLRVILIPYTKIFTTFESHMPNLALPFILIFPILIGFSYLDGKRIRKKLLQTIENSRKSRAERSKVNK